MHTSDADLRRILTENRSVAVLGAKSDAGEAACYVPKYLQAQGWRVIGVNPKLAGVAWMGTQGVASLAALGAVDVIEVFRRSDVLPAIAEEILALPWRPRVVWFQLGISHDEAAARLRAAGIEVVQNRCMMPEHRRLVATR